MHEATNMRKLLSKSYFRFEYGGITLKSSYFVFFYQKQLNRHIIYKSLNFSVSVMVNYVSLKLGIIRFSVKQ